MDAGCSGGRAMLMQYGKSLRTNAATVGQKGYGRAASEIRITTAIRSRFHEQNATRSKERCLNAVEAIPALFILREAAHRRREQLLARAFSEQLPHHVRRQPHCVAVVRTRRARPQPRKARFRINPRRANTDVEPASSWHKQWRHHARARA